MKKWTTFLFLLYSFAYSFGQDDAALAAPLGLINAPSTGCSLTSTETVTVRIFNAGPGTINAPFDVSFSITGPVNTSATETVAVGSIAPNSTFTYTFTATADASLTGVYTMDATVTVPGDPNSTNDTYSGYTFTNNAASNGGTATGGGNICNGSNSGNITLVGNVGNVINWESSTDMGVTWVNISNTTTSQSYNNLTTETWYRANVQNASCAVATSTIAKLLIDPISIGGTTSGGITPACSGSNSGTIILSGKTGNVMHWEISIDGGFTWTPVANTTTSFPYTNLTTTTRFRAFVQSGTCPGVYSTQRQIVINPPTVGGSVTADATECSGSNSATLTLGGQTGTVQNWQFSTDGGTVWTNIANTTTSQNYTNLTTSTMYRAQVKSGACAIANSSPATITVVANSNGGLLGSSTTVCDGVNQDTLALTGFTGTILDWESSTDGGTTWIPLGNTNDSLEYLNLTTQTMYRAIVQAGSCPSAMSNIATISIDATSQGGNLSGNSTVCASGNSGVINLAGQTGSPIGWEFSNDGGTTWNLIANMTASEAYNNLASTTLYRAEVQNGSCASTYSDTATITVDPITVGGTINSNTTVCSGSNTGTVNLVGETGNVLSWENSIDGGFTWLNIANTTTSQSYLNVTANTLYRANLQSGVCPPAQSGIVTITVDQPADAGNIFGATTVCEGSNAGTLTLLGSSGSILDWETSTDGGLTWVPVGNTTSVENYTNLIATTDYRAIASSGVCPNDTSAIATMNVDALTVGGAVTSDAIVCELSNSGILNLSGHTGSVLNWEMSTDMGSTWLILSNTFIFQNYLDLNTTTEFRAVIKNGVCPSQTSGIATISVSPQTVPGAVSSSATVCEGQNSGILTMTGFSGIILDWEESIDNGTTWTSLSNNTTTQSYTNLVDTTWYRAIVQNGICPQDTAAIAYINLYPAPAVDFIQDTVCNGFPMNFVNTTTNSSGFVTLYSWDFGDGNNSTAINPSYTYGAPGSYNAILFAMNNFGCSDTASHLMQVDASPVISIVPLTSTAFCDGGSVQLDATLDPNYTYSWTTGETTSTIVVDSSYYYHVDVTDITNNCTASDSIEVVVFPLPVAYAGIDTNVALGYSVILTGSGGSTYDWTPTTGLDNPFVANPICAPNATTTYTLTVTDLNGCSASDSVIVILNGDIILTIYDIITPNGDGFNDTWYIENILNYPNNNLSVFNRYGQPVYEKTGYVNDWDGTFNGDPLPDGAYYYVLELTDSGTIYKGALNIVRSQN